MNDDKCKFLLDEWYNRHIEAERIKKVKERTDKIKKILRPDKIKPLLDE